MSVRVAGGLLVLALAFGPVSASACWVCQQLENYPMECESSLFETGGTECTLKCKTNSFGTSYCICSTQGSCDALGGGCQFGPCPPDEVPSSDRPAVDPVEHQRKHIEAQLELEVERALEASEYKLNPGFRLAWPTLEAIETLDPVAGAVLFGLADRNGVLYSGAYQGMVTIVEPGSDSELIRNTVRERYSFTVSVEARAEKIRFNLELADYPHLGALRGQLTRKAGANRIEILGRDGQVEVRRW